MTPFIDGVINCKSRINKAPDYIWGGRGNCFVGTDGVTPTLSWHSQRHNRSNCGKYTGQPGTSLYHSDWGWGWLGLRCQDKNHHWSGSWSWPGDVKLDDLLFQGKKERKCFQWGMCCTEYWVLSSDVYQIFLSAPACQWGPRRRDQQLWCPSVTQSEAEGGGERHSHF